MSTGLECWFVEPRKGEWFYILELYGSPKGCWSWLDSADAYGPFGSQEAAYEHLHEHHPNPGGFSVFDSDTFAALAEETRRKLEGLTERPIPCGGRNSFWVII